MSVHPLRVTQLTEFASRRASGVFESVRGLSRALHEEHLAQVRVVTRWDEDGESDSPAWGAVDVQRVRVSSIRSLITGAEMAQACLSAPMDILHVHSMWTCAERSVVNLVRRGVKTPYVFSPRGTFSPWALRYKRWKKSLSWPIWERVLVANAACIHALNHAEADMVRMARVSAPICVIPNGVWLPPDFTRERTGNRRKLLFLGRIHPIKGVAELITAWGKLPANIRNEWQLVLAGWDDSPEASSYRALAAQVAPDGIVFPGPAFGETKNRLFKEADAFILPSHSEGLPTAVLEAWGFGLPAIITDACNLAVGVQCGAAVRIEPEADNIAAVLADILSRPEPVLAEMGRAGRKLVEERFSWKTVAAQMASVYRWVLGGDRPECVVSG